MIDHRPARAALLARALLPARPASAPPPVRGRRVRGRRAWGWGAGWLGCAGWAGLFPLLSPLGPHRTWGALAAVGYLLAAAVALLPGAGGPGRSGWVALGGAGLLPLGLLVATGSGQSEVGVLARAGGLLLAHGSPYLDAPAGPGEVTPYLPGMALFGLPHALLRTLLPAGGPVADPRLWCAAAFLAALWAARRVRPAPAARVGMVALLASPPVALALAVSGWTCR
ncbi:hypothetical protein HUT16_28830 [Kitasatospora sp. NA04385]|uniref:hypothetical protein n=1 Tax=Kitasatospora sp. NA04385 TaxID=2742135 RepID=UPI0015907925|nr:hypothetical protein [Kitasatospora sp. NA04385]QKW22555.1 hypothetical protein HUT16_28830 [Kitasatospora sp. NA04385]